MALNLSNLFKSAKDLIIELDKIEEISKEEYDLFLEEKQKKENFYNFKSNILKSIQNDYFFINISYEDLSKLNTFIEEIKVKK